MCLKGAPLVVRMTTSLPVRPFAEKPTMPIADGRISRRMPAFSATQRVEEREEERKPNFCALRFLALSSSWYRRPFGIAAEFRTVSGLDPRLRATNPRPGRRFGLLSSTELARFDLKSPVFLHLPLGSSRSKRHLLTTDRISRVLCFSALFGKRSSTS